VFCVPAEALRVQSHTATAVSTEQPLGGVQARHLRTIINFETYQFDF